MKTPRILTTTIALLLAPAAFAVVETWDGGGANDNFSTGANWADNTAPASSLASTDLVFGSGSLTPEVDVPFSARSVTFNISFMFGGFSLSGQALSLGATGIANDGTSGAIFGNQINFGGAATSSIIAQSGLLIFNNTVTLPTGTLTVTGANTTSFENISGTSTLNKTGSGTMTWTPNAATVCDVTVSAGTLTMGADGVADLFTSGASIAVNGTSTFNMNESLTLDGAVLTRATGADMNLAAGKTLRVQNGGDVVMTGAYANTTDSTITVTGAGSSFTGNSSLSFSGASALNVTAGGTVAAGAGVNVGTSGDGSVFVTSSGSSLSGGILNVGLAGATGSAVFSSSSSGMFSTINVGASNTAGTSGTLTIQNGASVTATALVIANSAGDADGTVTITGADSSLTITGTGITAIGAGVLTTGALNVSSGGTFHSGTGSTTVRPTGSITINGGTFSANGNLTLDGGQFDRLAGVFTLAAGRTFTVQNGSGAEFTGAFSNDTASTIVVTGAGSALTSDSALSINGGSTFSALLGGDVSTGGGAFGVGTSGGNGTATIADAGSSLSAGALNVGQNGNTGSLTFSAGSVGTFALIGVDNSGLAGTSGLLQIQSGAVVTGTSLILAGSSVANTGTITITGTNSRLTLSGAANATIGASANSSGTLNVGTRGTFNSGTGVTTVNATGTVAIIDSGTFNANGSVTLNGGQLTRDAGADFLLDAGRTFTVQNGGDATLTGDYSNGTASSIVVTGAGSTLSTTGNLGILGGSTLSVAAGGNVSSAAALNIGTTSTGGVVTVSGAGSALIVTGASATTIGPSSGSAATVNIGSGGIFTTGTGLTTVNATGDLNVNAGGTMIVRGNMNVATSLDIGSGGVVILGGSPPPAPEFALGEFDFGLLESGAQTAPVPEPGVGALLLSALAMLGLRQSRASKKTVISTGAQAGEGGRSGVEKPLAFPRGEGGAEHARPPTHRLRPREEKLEVSPLRSARWPASAPVEMTGF